MLNVTAAILRPERGSPCPYQLSSTGSSRPHTDNSTLIIFYCIHLTIRAPMCTFPFLLNASVETFACLYHQHLHDKILVKINRGNVKDFS